MKGARDTAADATGRMVRVGADVLTFTNGRGHEYVVQRVAGERVVVASCDGIPAIFNARDVVMLPGIHRASSDAVTAPLNDGRRPCVTRSSHESHRPDTA